MAGEVETEPSEITVADGVVLVDGPDGEATTLTADAAIETGHRLIEGGAIANDERIAAEHDQRQANRRRDIDSE